MQPPDQLQDFTLNNDTFVSLIPPNLVLLLIQLLLNVCFKCVFIKIKKHSSN